MTSDALFQKTLEQYFNLDASPDPPAGSLRALEIDDADSLERLIAAQPPEMADQSQPNVSGVMTGKLYSAFPVAVVFAAALFDRALPVDRNTVRIQPGGSHGFRFWIPEEALVAAPQLAADPAQRSELLRDLLEELFERHVAAVWKGLAEHTGADLRSLWSLLSTNLATMFLRSEQEPYRSSLGITENRREQLRTDEELLFAQGAQGPFPQRSRNPLRQATRLFTPPAEVGPPIYLRTKCCLRYRIRVGGEAVPYCSTCPKISDNERLRLMKHPHPLRDAQ